ncbi:hypothetical protein ACFE04_020338 [Oxalis oulophora]
MATSDRKRKSRDESKKKTKKFSKKGSSNERGSKKGKTGPRLPFTMRMKLDRIDPKPKDSDDDDVSIRSDDVNDFYEYEEETLLTESNKNRFDQVESYEYELPEEFEDENIASDDDDDDNDNHSEQDEERHGRMLQGITGIPSQAFQGLKERKTNFVMKESLSESQYNPSRDILDGTGRLSVEDFLDGIPGADGSNLRKAVDKMETKSKHIYAPLPKSEREKIERKVANEHLKKDVSKWLPLVSRNREAPTLYFDQDRDTGFSTVGAIASEFQPRTDFEKKMASLHYDDNIVEAHKEDGARLLELNKISVDDYKQYKENVAKMRNLLFRHEIKSKRIKKIKSKAYRRVLKKGRSKTAPQDTVLDPEAAKEEAIKQERKRAEERMTLKHKNTSKWAKRIIGRGLSQQDDGTRAAIAAQLSAHASLTRKAKNYLGSSSEESTDEDDENSSGSDPDMPSKSILKAKEKMLRELENDDEVPKSGLHSLPFMVRGLKKREEAVIEEGKIALEEFDRSLKQLDGDGGDKSKQGMASGRRVFGVNQPEVKKNISEKSTDKMKLDNFYNNNSDSDDDFEAKEDDDVGQKNVFQKDNTKPGLPDKDPQDSVFEGFDDHTKEPMPKTTYEVAIFASGEWKKSKSTSEVETSTKKPPKVGGKVQKNQNLEEAAEESESDGEGQMVDGVLSAGPKASYELPSQEELIRLAFAGDDVEEHFEKEKQEVLNEENPEPEKPALVPGWGQWTNVQRRKGLPSWMVNEHESSKKKREEALKKRKDARLKNVIISEKQDKKAEKLQSKTLPYPFTSKEVYEQSMRMPIGPDFNPATTVGALTRPDVSSGRIQ